MSSIASTPTRPTWSGVHAERGGSSTLNTHTHHAPYRAAERGPAAAVQVSGGEVTDKCAAVAGNALCFAGAGSRVAATAPINTIAGGVLRFALRMGGDEHGLAVRLSAESAERGGDFATAV